MVHVTAFLVVLALYLFSLPVLSRLLNPLAARLTLNKWTNQVCNTPVEHLKCADGGNASMLAIDQGYKNNFICGGGEGLFGQAICPREKLGYSLSGFLGTASATGALVLCTSFHFVQLWRFHEIYVGLILQPSKCLHSMSWWFLWFFQVSFNIWLIFPSVSFIELHGFFLPFWVAFACAHYDTLARMSYQKADQSSHSSVPHRRIARLIRALLCIGLVSVAGPLPLCANLPMDPNMSSFWMFWSTYGFWFWESFSLVCLFAPLPCSYLFTDVVCCMETLEAEVKKAQKAQSLQFKHGCIGLGEQLLSK